MAIRLVVEFYFPDGVNESVIQNSIESSLEKSGYSIGDIFWDKDEYNEEEE